MFVEALPNYSTFISDRNTHGCTVIGIAKTTKYKKFEHYYKIHSDDRRRFHWVRSIKKTDNLQEKGLLSLCHVKDNTYIAFRMKFYKELPPFEAQFSDFGPGESAGESVLMINPNSQMKAR